MIAPERGHIDDLIAKALSLKTPHEVGERLRSQLAELRSQLAIVQPASRGVRLRKRAAWWGLGITAAAGIAAALMFGLFVRTQNSFAQVAAAALKQPWIHVQVTKTEEGSGQIEGEVWYSPSLALSASRQPDSIEYHDHRLDVYYVFDRKEQVLYRVPGDGRGPPTYYEGLVNSLTILLKQESMLDKSLDHFHFLGLERDKMKVSDQEMTRLKEGDHEWLEYRMTVSYADWPRPARMVFRVDEATKLPHLCRIERQSDGKSATFEQQFDYPVNGPASIHDLGVPKTTKLVDRVPAGDIKRILETVRAGRERMDDYRAVFVNRLEGLDYVWWTETPEVMYRKGDKFRTDFASGISGEVAEVERPGDGEDLGKWWRDRAKFFKYYPECITRGSTVYTSSTKYVTDADGSNHEDIVSVHRAEHNSTPGEMYPPEYSMRPEFACRPPLGVGGAHFQPVLNLNPSEGPPGCILLAVRHTNDEGRINEKGIGLADENRYWLDPERDYIVMRWDMLTGNEPGKEEIHESDTVEEVAKSPRGIWYATRIRRSFPSLRDEKGNFADQVYHLYVDFDVDLPDALFEPPVPGRIR